jgi:hypothetical protein
MNPYIYIFIAAMAMFSMAACKTKQPVASNNAGATLQAVVYKTKADYSKYVTVTLNAGKSAIVAYPAPKDVFYNGKIAYPTHLANGYWLDNRGITANSVFISITYDDYAKLSEAPKLKDMMDLIIDKDPFTEIYNLGDRQKYTDEVNQINNIIKKGELKKFAVIK